MLETYLSRLYNWIEGSKNPLFTDSAITLDANNKHSIDLHIAGLLVEAFQKQAAKVPSALTVLMDENLYGGDVLGNRQLIITKLVRNEVGVRDDAGNVLLAANGMLTHFTNDLQKLGNQLAGLNEAAQSALVAQAVEWYYWQGSGYKGQEVFVRTGDGPMPPVLRYTTALGANLPGAENKAKAYLKTWLEPLVKANDGVYQDALAKAQQWSVVTALEVKTNTSAQDPDKTQMCVGQGGPESYKDGCAAGFMVAEAGNDLAWRLAA